MRLASETDEPATRWVLLCPPGGQPPPLRRIEARVVGARQGSLHLWEQWVLPRAARDGLLLNLTGSAPAWARQQVCTLHDAAVFDRPEAYAPLFRGWYRWLFRRLARTAVALNTVSAFSQGPAGRAARHCPASASTSSTTAATISFMSGRIPATSARWASRGRRFVLAVGSENVTKNFGAVIEAMADLADDRRVAGDRRRPTRGGVRSGRGQGRDLGPRGPARSGRRRRAEGALRRGDRARLRRRRTKASACRRWRR